MIIYHLCPLYLINHYLNCKVRRDTKFVFYFSGVIFALKVLTTENQDSGMKYAVWTELVLIYLLVPGSSFMGHLAGILAGLTFSKTRIGKFLKALIEKCTGNL